MADDVEGEDTTVIDSELGNGANENTQLSGDRGGVVEFGRGQQGPRQWTLKGISPAAIEQSREAARRSGMKLNSWVTAALQQAAEEHRDGEAMCEADLAHRIDEIDRYIREEFGRLKAQQDTIEDAMRNINAFLVKMYAHSS